MIEIYRNSGFFNLERGGRIRDLEIAYSTFGKLNERGDNVIWVCHALTANSDVADWWPNTVTEGGFLDPERWFVVCANIVGSNYGTTGPLSVNPETEEPYFLDFPKITIRDIVRAHILLSEHLNIGDIHAVVGSSLGGFQAMEWALMQPERIKKLVLIATDSHVSPWAAGLNETQRMAIRADKTFGERHSEAGKDGMAAARAIALLSYRGPSGYNLSQRNNAQTPEFAHRVATYQTYQGEKLCKRFNAYSYMTILDTFDSHDIRRGRGENEKDILAAIKSETACIAIPTDILFPPETMKRLSEGIGKSSYFEITSEFGHDGFLVEHQQLNDILNEFLQKR